MILKVSKQSSAHGHMLFVSLAAACCMFVGIGIARFAYTPILPLMVQYHWLTSLQAGYLGSINFSGYLLGALIARTLIAIVDVRILIKIALLVCVISLFLCGFNLGFIWLSLWRFLAGLAGALIMVCTPAVMLSSVSQNKKAMLSCIMFSGVGLGIIVSAQITAYVHNYTLSYLWFLLGIVSLISFFIVCYTMPSYTKCLDHQDGEASMTVDKKTIVTVCLLTIMYFLYGIGFTPHTLFIVEYITKELHYSMRVGTLNWSIFGIGTFIGTISVGFIAIKIGVMRSLISCYMLACLSVILIITTTNVFLLTITSFIMGSLFLSIVSLSSAQLQLIIKSHHSFVLSWGIMTVLFALGQTLGAYIMSDTTSIFIGKFPLLFIIAISALTIAVVISFLLYNMLQRSSLMMRQESMRQFNIVKLKD